MNDKMGGDLERIKVVGQYLIEVWTAAGMDMSKVAFRWCADEITANARTYWTQCLDVARRFTIARIKKCCQIMGRLEDSLTAAQILYPIMQCTDIFFLRADVCQLGVDQRKVNMLAREYCDSAGIKLKPIILSHHMLLGLKQGQAKMSKSDPDSAIFMEDSAEDVARKIAKAYCPRVPPAGGGALEPTRKEDEGLHLTEDELKNPCLDYVQYIVFSAPGSRFTAGGKTYADFESVRSAFVGETLSEADLKSGLVSAINGLLQPVRDHFATNAEASRYKQLIEEWRKEASGVRAAKLTRLDALGGAGGGAPSPQCVVFAPLPSARPTLAAALDTLRCLAAAPAGHERLLWVADCSAFCQNCVSGGKTREDDFKAIGAANSLLVAALRAIAPELMAGVRVLIQSEAVLANARNYWTSVMNAGRAFSLSAVLGACDEAGADAAGHVVTTLMHVADVLALSGAADAATPSCFCGTPAQCRAHHLAASYLERPEFGASGVLPPRVVEVAQTSLRLKALDAEGDVNLDADAELLLFDAQLDVQRKMKKAFCEPANVGHCPPIVLVSELVLPYGAAKRLTVKRKEENGGDLDFTEGASLRDTYASGALHPGDLKPAARDAIDAVLQRVRDAVKADGELGKAEKEMQKVLKRSSTAKGKK
jgi:tyrosyl-tRNA synthetase